LNNPSESGAHGLLLVNKPVGITSFDVIRRLRHTTGARKIGHAGTLDPLASGLMLMLFGTACKKAADFSKLDKSYSAVVKLGFTSSTGDNEGELIKGGSSVPSLTEIQEVLTRFTGSIVQTPSQFSAIKIRGKEAYKRARAGEIVQMPARNVTIWGLALSSYAYPLLHVQTDVSSGTYIRTLAEDIGEALGTGAYLDSLVRTRVGKFELGNAVDCDLIGPAELGQRLQVI